MGDGRKEQGGDQAEEIKIEWRQLVKFVVELGPLVVFFTVNSQAGIIVGTGWFMVATAVALTASKLVLGRVPVMPLISGIFILGFGGLTLWLHDPFYIKIKPTIVNLMFSGILFGGLSLGHPLLKHVFGEAFSLTDEGWRILTIRWAVFFLFLAGLNEVVWRNFSEDFWVSFKLWGLMPLTMVFAMSQIGLLQRYEKSKEREQLS
ncbi:MAG: septation protein A [Alphaproteobacteria bacterium BRH_c36]|nr:MAG: septation protein A [Alphaproteobacteria bacterium BRH_c36]